MNSKLTVKKVNAHDIIQQDIEVIFPSGHVCTNYVKEVGR